jgi:hypothetical protein
MMMKQRRQISQAVQSRLRAGEDKASIYNELKEKWPAAAVERSLAQWPTEADRQKNRYLNYSLLMLVIFFTVIKVLSLIGLFQTLEKQQMVALFPAAALTLIIHGYIIYGVKNGNLIGYLLVMLLGITSLLSVRSVSGANFIPLALTAASIVLAWIQKARLFPNVSLILRHKRDADENIIF